MNARDWSPLVRRLRAALQGRVETGASLARLTTYRLGGPAAVYIEPAHTTDVIAMGEELRAADRALGPIPVLALGRGSNIVVSDEGWEGVVIRLSPGAFSWIDALEDGPGCIAGSSTSLPLLANWSARRGLTGMEFLVAIPGSVGGAVRMNAGAHGREVANCLMSAEVFDLDALRMDHRPAEGLDLAYRHSNLTERHLVLEALFRLEPSDAEAVRKRIDSYRRHRAATQPGALQNAGSVFKNPPGDHAGRLIESAGLKGLRVGGAAVSNLHANFFVADEGARAQDVYDLVEHVRAHVEEKFGIDLTPEIRFVGRFKERTRGVAR
jgi:UDP-N-acetylmuramate dehydrogenase